MSDDLVLTRRDNLLNYAAHVASLEAENKVLREEISLLEEGARERSEYLVGVIEERERLRTERDEMAVWIKDCTAKISNVIGGGSELFNRHGDQFRLDADFVCRRISTMRERHHEAMHRAVRAERATQEPKP